MRYTNSQDRGFRGQYAGLGILYAKGRWPPCGSPERRPWTRQAQQRDGYDGLRGASVFSFAADPDNQRRIVAATTRGLHLSRPGGPADVDPWSLVTVAAWDTAAEVAGQREDRGDRCELGRRYAGYGPSCARPAPLLTGLWRSDNGPGRAVRRRPVDARESRRRAQVDRIALAAGGLPPDVLYVIASGRLRPR